MKQAVGVVGEGSLSSLMSHHLWDSQCVPMALLRRHSQAAADSEEVREKYRQALDDLSKSRDHFEVANAKALRLEKEAFAQMEREAVERAAQVKKAKEEVKGALVLKVW